MNNLIFREYRRRYRIVSHLYRKKFPEQNPTHWINWFNRNISRQKNKKKF